MMGPSSDDTRLLVVTNYIIIPYDIKLNYIYKINKKQKWLKIVFYVYEKLKEIYFEITKKNVTCRIFRVKSS